MFDFLLIVLCALVTCTLAVLAVPLLTAMLLVFTLMAFMQSIKVHLEDDDPSRYQGKE